MATRLDVARALGSASGRRPARSAAREAATSTRYGTAQADAAAGETVRVLMDGSDEEVEVRVDAPVSKGERVKIVKQGGTYTVVAIGTMAKTYATKVEVNKTAEGLEAKIGKKVDEQGALDALSTLIKATEQGIEVGKVDEDGKHATPYGVMSSDGFFEVMSASGLPMFIAASDRTCKREHMWSPLSPSDSSFVPTPTLAIVGVELLMSSPGGISSGAVRLNLGGYSISDYMFLEFVYTDGTRSYAQRLYQPALNASTSLSRTVSDGEALYSASVTVKVDAAGSITLSNNVQLYISPTGTTTSEGKLRLVKVLGWA